MLQTWSDTSFQWDPSGFQNVKSVQFPATEIWMPDIALENMYVYTR